MTAGWHAHGCSRGHVFEPHVQGSCGLREPSMAALRLAMAPFAMLATTVVHPRTCPRLTRAVTGEYKHRPTKVYGLTRHKV